MLDMIEPSMMTLLGLVAFSAGFIDAVAGVVILAGKLA